MAGIFKLVPALLLAIAPLPTLAASGGEKTEASIPFADHGGVSDWRADGNRTIYFQDQHRRWYRATLFAPALDLPYAERIGIDARPSGTLDKFGAVIVKGQRYPFSAFVAVDGPPRKHTARK